MGAIRNVNTLFNDFVSILFPKVCIHCGTSLVHQEEHLCTTCILDLPKTNFHLVTDNFVEQKFVFEPKVQSASAFLYFNKRGIAQSIIHHLKYKNLPEVGTYIGKIYGEELKKAEWGIDFIIPVPLHQSKLRKRGYNQSEFFAEGLSQVLNVPVRNDLIKRQVKTQTQTRKSKLERWKNIRSVYELVDLPEIRGKRLMIVDDVLTTGATIGELASLLATAEPDSIYIATIAAGQ